jgi:hypothetical protein
MLILVRFFDITYNNKYFRFMRRIVVSLFSLFVLVLMIFFSVKNYMVQVDLKNNNGALTVESESDKKFD